MQTSVDNTNGIVDQPEDPTSSVSGAEHPEYAPNLHSNFLLGCRHFLVRNKTAILLWTACISLSAFCIEARIKPIYRASSSVIVEQVKPSIAPTDQTRKSSTLQPAALASILLSDAVDARIKQAIQDDPSFPSEMPTVTTRQDWLSQLLRTMHLGGRTPDSLSQLLSRTHGGIRITPSQDGASTLILLCDSNSPLLAVTYCEQFEIELQNALVAMRGTVAAQVSRTLMEKAVEARDRAAKAESALARAEGGPDATANHSHQESESPLQERLGSELIESRAETMAREAELDAARRGPSNQDGALLERMRAQYAAAAHREKLLEISFEQLDKTIGPRSGAEFSIPMLRRNAQRELLLSKALVRRAGEAGITSVAADGYVIHTAGIVSVPRSPIYPHREVIIFAACCFALLTGIAGALFRDRKRNILRTPAEVARYSEMPELGVIPSASVSGRSSAVRQQGAAHVAKKEISSWGDSGSLLAESYRNAVFSALLEDRSKHRSEIKGCSIYVVSSPRNREGKHAVASNLGIALSKFNKRVTLIDADLSRPSLHHTFNLPHGLGLRGALAGDISHHNLDTMFCKATCFPGLTVIPAGGTGVERDVPQYSTQWKLLLEAISQTSDCIVINAPAVLQGPEFDLAAHHAHAGILVLRSGVSTREDLIEARDRMLKTGLPVLGTIFYDFDPRREGLADYYAPFHAYRDAARA